MPLFDQLLDIAPNWAIILVCAAGMGALSLGVSGLAHRLFPRRVGAESSGLGDNAHEIILSFAVFVLAIALGQAHLNMDAASDIVEQEAFQLERFDRQLLRYGDEATRAIRGELIAYIESVVAGGWPDMARARLGGTRETRRILDRLADRIYGLEPAGALQAALKPALLDSLDGLERERELRLEKSSTTIPSLFWAVILLLVFAGMVLCGRYHRTRTNLFFIATHMAMIGIGMAFLAILDVPFRGETSVSRQPLIESAATIAKSLPD